MSDLGIRAVCRGCGGIHRAWILRTMGRCDCGSTAWVELINPFWIASDLCAEVLHHGMLIIRGLICDALNVLGDEAYRHPGQAWLLAGLLGVIVAGWCL